MVPFSPTVFTAAAGSGSNSCQNSQIQCKLQNWDTLRCSDLLAWFCGVVVAANLLNNNRDFREEKSFQTGIKAKKF